MQRKVLYFNNFTIFPHNHRHSWALLEASCRSTPTPTFLSLAKIVPKIVIGYSGGAGRAGGALASGLVVAPASSHKLQSESLEKQKGGWKGCGAGEFSATFLATCGNCWIYACITWFVVPRCWRRNLFACPQPSCPQSVQHFSQSHINVY